MLTEVVCIRLKVPCAQGLHSSDLFPVSLRQGCGMVDIASRMARRIVYGLRAVPGVRINPYPLTVIPRRWGTRRCCLRLEALPAALVQLLSLRREINRVM